MKPHHVRHCLSWAYNGQRTRPNNRDWIGRIDYYEHLLNVPWRANLPTPEPPRRQGRPRK
jgi:hypothetical protein